MPGDIKSHVRLAGLAHDTAVNILRPARPVGH